MTPTTPIALAAAVLLSGGASAQSCPPPTNYCATSPNSAGTGALMSWSGTPGPASADFSLQAHGCPPGQWLLFYYGAAPEAVPFGNGMRCVEAGGIGMFRFRPTLIDASGTAATTVDSLQAPAGTLGTTGTWHPGDTWYCQGWYRDPLDGGAYFNLTDGLEVPICVGGTYPDMVLGPGGTFEMGDHHGQGFSGALPVHSVTLDAFHMKVHEVSNQEYADYLNQSLAEGRILVTSENLVRSNVWAIVTLCDTNLSFSTSGITWDGASFGSVPGKESHPMLRVTWYGACAYANAMSRADGLRPCYDEWHWDCDFSANGYRLPTEAEWEYAARGGQQNPYYRFPWGDSLDGSKANYYQSGDPYEQGPIPTTTPVGYYDGNQSPAGVDMANGYGLYDMLGNVSEWCWDRYRSDYYSNSPVNNPKGPSSGWLRVVRDGHWQMYPWGLPTARRDYREPDEAHHWVGFRIVAAQ